MKVVRELKAVVNESLEDFVIKEAEHIDLSVLLNSNNIVEDFILFVPHWVYENRAEAIQEIRDNAEHVENILRELAEDQDHAHYHKYVEQLIDKITDLEDSDNSPFDLNSWELKQQAFREAIESVATSLGLIEV